MTDAREVTVSLPEAQDLFWAIQTRIRELVSVRRDLDGLALCPSCLPAMDAWIAGQTGYSVPGPSDIQGTTT